jgi:Arc/MetJ-type ribon-helix-helix transcriptional regulator
LELVAFLIPEAYLVCLGKLIEEGLYPSRSVALKFAIQHVAKRTSTSGDHERKGSSNKKTRNETTRID